MKYLFLICITLILAFTWYGLADIKRAKSNTADEDFKKLTREKIINAEYKSHNEIKAEEIAEKSGMKGLISGLYSTEKIQFIDVDWNILSKLDPKTGKLPNKYSYLLNANIRIAGYITPLQGDSPDNVHEFLFSPYIGACIHVPPPPENQAIYVKLEKPTNFFSLWQPTYLYGNLELLKNHLKSYDGSFEAVTGYAVKKGIVLPKVD